MRRLVVTLGIISVLLYLLGFWAGQGADAKGCRDLGVARTIRCAANYVHGVSPDKAVAVAWCESRFHPYAVNGPYLGIFQNSRYYWPGRVARYWWGRGSSVFNYRISAFVTVRMVKHTTWSPWGCA